jgi:hypothetical protein
MKKDLQLTFVGLKNQGRSRFGGNDKCFGGSFLKNSNAKSKRPISTKRSMHLVMRSLVARGSFSFLKKDREIRGIINLQARNFGIKIYRIANGGNHLHLIILPSSRQAFVYFLRSISGLIARLILGSQRGNPAHKRFWEKRPFTRIVEWGRDYRAACQYLVRNTLEALGFIPYQPRGKNVAQLNSTA